MLLLCKQWYALIKEPHFSINHTTHHWDGFYTFYFVRPTEYCDERFDIIVSNPPYIPLSEKKSIQKEVTYEPDIALYTKDEKGLEFYKKITEEAPKHLNSGGYLLFELGIEESTDVADIMNQNGFTQIQVVKDLANIDRVIIGQKGLN